jgi:hypothetical protein
MGVILFSFSPQSLEDEIEIFKLSISKEKKLQRAERVMNKKRKENQSPQNTKFSRYRGS